MKFDKASIKLDFRLFAIDCDVENIDHDDAVKFYSEFHEILNG